MSRDAAPAASHFCGEAALPVKDSGLIDSGWGDPLKGGYAGCSECHLKPDLLLIYIQTSEELRLIRLGSQSELFA